MSTVKRNKTFECLCYLVSNDVTVVVLILVGFLYIFLFSTCCLSTAVLHLQKTEPARWCHR